MTDVGYIEPATNGEAVRLRTLKLDADAFCAMLKTHLPTVVHFRGMPDDARPVDLYHDAVTGDLVMVVWSSTFEPVDPSTPELPEVDVVASTLVLEGGV